MKIKNLYTKIFLFSALLLILIVLGIFFLRTPVLVVSDPYFNDLYGKKRALYAGIRTSFSLFRRVQLVTLADGVGPDGIVLAVSQASENPFCVCFPNRYADAALIYQNQFSSVKTILFAGKEDQKDLPSGLSIIKTDAKSDLYRAGFSAALLSEGKTGKILVYIENARNSQEKNFFEQGIIDSGIEIEVQFIDLNDEFTSSEPISCIVLTEISQDPFITEQNIPIILFSWADPALFSTQIKVIISDSPWEMLLPVIKQLKKSENTIDLTNEEDPVYRIDMPSFMRIHPKSGLPSKEKRLLNNAFLQKKDFIK
jgi:hypothetical protein